ncbi:hypothetical protein Salat_2419800 [Sesamum alatum]|uniref:Uncharacterized protein n=1 Tax=Sesamum alatum TaxID=300844 RepID=A0AAE1XY10_9LAMI|nr:hypothetical protein Salat_2419800 [Sesamum alatum]
MYQALGGSASARRGVAGGVCKVYVELSGSQAGERSVRWLAIRRALVHDNSLFINGILCKFIFPSREQTGLVLHCKVTHRAFSVNYYLLGIYGANDRTMRRELWAKITDYVELMYDEP